MVFWEDLQWQRAVDSPAQVVVMIIGVGDRDAGNTSDKDRAEMSSMLAMT